MFYRVYNVVIYGVYVFKNIELWSSVVCLLEYEYVLVGCRWFERVVIICNDVNK